MVLGLGVGGAGPWGDVEWEPERRKTKDTISDPGRLCPSCPSVRPEIRPLGPEVLFTAQLQ